MMRKLVRRGSWALTVGGGGLAIWAFASTGPGQERRIGALSVGLSGVMVGAVGFAHDSLSRVTRDVDEAYKLGGDIQYEKGFQAGRRIAKPVVVDLTGGDSDGDNEELRVALDVPEVTIRMPKADPDTAVEQ
jgi:hypothetical protein